MDRSSAASPSMPPVVSVAEVASTNAEAFRLARQGERGPLWIVAERQTAGRGRAGRQWTSIPGNLHASCLVELGCSATTALQLSLVAGVAVHDAVTGLVGPELAAKIRLKWPNDLMLADAKLGGILVETAGVGGVLTAVVGVGLNIVAAPQDLHRAVASLADRGAVVSLADVVGRLVCSFEAWRGTWQEGAVFAQIRAAWLARARSQGQGIAINTGSAVIRGTFEGLGETGALIMRDEAGISRQFSFGDVSLIPPDGGVETLT